MSSATADSLAQHAAPVQSAAGRSLFHPLVDFLALGGLTAVIAPLFLLPPPAWFEYSKVLAITTLIAHAINNPHFAHSYHLFYRGFLSKSFGDGYAPAWRGRYLFAGLAVPLALVGYLAWAIAGQHLVALGYSVNLMFFTVGWHYTKQGYGMLVLDSVLKRRYFDEAEKRLLLLNGYAVWMLSWILANQVFAESQYWGIPWSSFAVPQPVLLAAEALVAASSGAVLLMLARRLNAGKAIPLNGLVAYLVSLYVWLLVRHPVLALVFPALHSLQYLIVVWRFELNRNRMLIHVAEGGSPDEPAFAAPFELGLRMVGFYALAVAMGWFGFWGFGELMVRWLPGPPAAIGSGVFLLAAWVFVNIHHYFIDSVLWRKGNPETGAYLFR
jgi:hypothetical protein